MPEVAEPTSEERVVPNLIIKRYTAQSDIGRWIFGMPCTAQPLKTKYKYW
jgi:hypothetical protein